MFGKIFVLSSLNLVGKLLGFVKTVVIASLFGASYSLDAFWVAYAVPRYFPHLFMSVFVVSYIPQFFKVDRTHKADWDGLNTLITVVFMFLLIITILFMLFSYPVVSILATGLEDSAIELASELFSLMALVTVLMGVNGMLRAISNVYGRFYLANLQSLILNVFLISACFVFDVVNNIYLLVITVVIATAIDTFILSYSNRKIISSFIRPRLNLHHSDFLAPIQKSGPLLVGYLGSIIMDLTDQWFASFEQEGAISIMLYATMIAYLPMEIFGKSLLQVSFPALSKSVTDIDKIMKMYGKAIRLLLLVLLPASLIFIVPNYNLVNMVFGYGEFGLDEVTVTAEIISILAVGLVIRGVTYYNYYVLHAYSKTWVPVIIGVIGVLINIFLNYVLSKIYGLHGIAIATTASLFVSFLLSTVYLLRFLYKKSDARLSIGISSVLAYSVVASSLYVVINNLFIFYKSSNTWVEIVLNMSFLTVYVIVLYLMALFLKFEETALINKYIKRFF